MNNLDCLKIKIVESQEEQYLVEFIESGIIMSVDKIIVDSKIKNGFYEKIV